MWNFGHVQTSCLRLGIWHSVVLTQSSIAARWPFRGKWLLLTKAYPPPHLPSAKLSRSPYPNACPCYCQPLPGLGDNRVPDPELPFSSVTPVKERPFLLLALSGTSPRQPLPTLIPWRAHRPGTGPPSSQRQTARACQVYLGPALALCSSCVGFQHFCICLGCVTWHFKMCCFLLRSLPMYAFNVPCQTDDFQETKLVPLPKSLEMHMCVPRGNVCSAIFQWWDGQAPSQAYHGIAAFTPAPIQPT